ncbi:histone deacetylase 9 [Thecamonas trahens ATCC 50062]|uniref:Histone deacetylase n=1 Tax=Thecamonas trahens ATCC 50062 TaxID=461836 RepID=A0A0L0DRP2_THETB|nr:histone deacetylase 9 [Thecamonas trahens ATCC 50062]KNC54922.1 histone deacetylase 9 [Thecamonas trahens ATCC 50062]|eukprot:XP_013753511.1 histone deacetylase 9 [Thecamonas trahens ATCC 50062]
MSSGLRVSYFHSESVGGFYYGRGHPMKPPRLSLTHALVKAYGLDRQMEVYSLRRATVEEALLFHTPEYVSFLAELDGIDLGSPPRTLPPATGLVLAPRDPYSARLARCFPPLGLPMASTSRSPRPSSLSHGRQAGHGHQGCLTPQVSQQSAEDLAAAKKALEESMRRHNLGHDDVPVFDGVLDFSLLSSGGSIDGAARLNAGVCDVAINWSGGLHHAKKQAASGFCYMNDIVLAILELLKFNPRVLYIDIDVHHGDGVEEAFYETDRVMTVSFHMYGEGFFPGTGAREDIGEGEGKQHAINVPLRAGIDDRSYAYIFKPVIAAIIESYQPTAIVLQCGADSLGCDRLGCFNLTIGQHADCLAFVKSFGIPLLVLGGGGYTVPNVARLWTVETATVLDVELTNDVIPYTEHFDLFGPSFKLIPDTHAGIANLNTRTYLDKMKSDILQQLKTIPFVPAVQMSTIPPAAYRAGEWNAALTDDADPDDRSAHAAGVSVLRAPGVEGELFAADSDNLAGS